MGDLLQKAMKGVDLSSPGATAHIFHNLMALVPWVPLLWFTLASLVLGAVVGWWRGRIWTGIWISLVIGPVALVVLMALPSKRSAPADDDQGQPPAR